MNAIDRRTFLLTSATTAAALALAARGQPAATEPTGIIDTNINLFDWPFRALKYRQTDALVAKLRKHRIVQAWAGSFEALFAKDLSGVNERLASECAKHKGFLVPFGSANLAWPDWQEDIRRCHEIHKMPGIRIYPGYQPFDLGHPELEQLLKICVERRLILQIVCGMEDPRVHHPLINPSPVNLRGLVKAVDAVPDAKVQLLHFPANAGAEFSRFIARPNTFLDISRVEGNGGIGRMLGTIKGLPISAVPSNRILFGSHAPFFPVETALLKLVESPLQRDQLDALMHRNARELLKS